MRYGMRYPVVLIVTGLLTITSGCGQNKLGRTDISGKVTLNGQPLPQGLIQFEPLEHGPGKVGSGTSIKQGEYSIPALKGLPPGEYRVRIHSSVAPTQHQQNNMPGAGPHTIGRELIPAAYNVNTQLTASVTAAGPNTFDFELKSP